MANKKYLVEVSMDRGRTWSQVPETPRFSSQQGAEEEKYFHSAQPENSLKHYRVKTVYNENK